jgi:hypothetical protein
MNREEFANKWAAVEIYEDGLPISIVIQARYNDLLADLNSLSLPPAEGAEEILERAFNNGAIRRITYIPDIRGIISAMNDFAALHAQRIADKMVEKKSPSNEQIHEAALAWARDHSEAPDKDCPDWLIRDYEAGAYFVRQCYGCLNKTDNLKIRER